MSIPPRRESVLLSLRFLSRRGRRCAWQSDACVGGVLCLFFFIAFYVLVVAAAYWFAFSFLFSSRSCFGFLALPGCIPPWVDACACACVCVCAALSARLRLCVCGRLLWWTPLSIYPLSSFPPTGVWCTPLRFVIFFSDCPPFPPFSWVPTWTPVDHISSLMHRHVVADDHHLVPPFSVRVFLPFVSRLPYVCLACRRRHRFAFCLYGVDLCGIECCPPPWQRDGLRSAVSCRPRFTQRTPVFTSPLRFCVR